MSTWQELLNGSIRDIEKLKEILQLTTEESEQMARIAENYPVCVNPYYLGLVNMEDRDDPIRKMCIPDIREFSEVGQKDTVGRLITLL